MPKRSTRLKLVTLKVGEDVRVHWDDAVSFGRMDGDASEIPLGRFVLRGLLAYFDENKVIVHPETDEGYVYGPELGDNAELKKLRVDQREALPRGMIVKIERVRTYEEGRLP